MTRYFGSETEYGIATPSDAFASPIITSTHLVVNYAATQASQRPRWDFSSESPLKDHRGFDLRRYHTVPVVDPNAVGVANVILPNGARFYVDHAHPEYSAPETTSALQAALYDAAGDVVAQEAVEAVAEKTARGESILQGHPPCPPLKIYKNNVDGKGASFGCHENYSYSRETDFEVLAAALIPFFVTRQVFCGAGRVGLGDKSQEPGFQISQRADYIEQEISLETTLNRGIINTRDESHTTAERGRLHIINGDATLSQIATFLKLGTTGLVLDAVEAGVDFSDLSLRNPVEAFRSVSRDLTCTAPLPLADGTARTAVDIQRAYAQRVSPATAEQREILRRWNEVLDLVEDDPSTAAHLVDWIAKLQLMRGFIARGASWDNPKIALIDLQYADIDPAKSLYHALVRKGRMETLFSQDQITAAVAQAPTDTRAFLRGELFRRWGNCIAAANWDSLLLVDQQDKGLFHVDLSRLDAGTDAAFKGQLTAAQDISQVMAILEQAGLGAPHAAQ